MMMMMMTTMTMTTTTTTTTMWNPFRMVVGGGVAVSLWWWWWSLSMTVRPVSSFVIRTPTTIPRSFVQINPLVEHIHPTTKTTIKQFPILLPTPIHSIGRIQKQQGQSRHHYYQSITSTQLYGIFGLGIGEIAIVIVGIALVLGPEKIVNLVRSSGDTAQDFQQELSKLPQEFQKGLEEGEIEARSRKARTVKVIRKKSENGDDDDEDYSDNVLDMNDR